LTSYQRQVKVLITCLQAHKRTSSQRSGYRS